MKRGLVILLVLSLVICCACSKSSEPIEGVSSETESEQSVIWQVGLSSTPVDGKHPCWQLLQFLQEEISIATDGKYQLELYHSSQLGNERDVLEGIKMGTYKFGVVTSSYLCTYSDVFNVFELPFLFRDYKHFTEVLQSDIAEDMYATLEKHGLVGIDMGVNGIYAISNNRRPILSPDDIKGLKIRTMEAPLQLATINTLGGQGTPMAWAEVYTALQQNTVDGVSTISFGFYSAKLYEVQRYCTQLEMFYVPMVIVANKQYWDGLPDKDKEKIRAAVKKAITERHYDDAIAQDGGGYDALEATGMMDVIRLGEYDREQFIKAVEPLYEQYDEQYGEWVKRIREM